MHVVLMTASSVSSRPVRSQPWMKAKEFWRKMPIPVPLPRHVAVVMDGNRRWASQRHVATEIAHFAAEQAVDDLIDHCIIIGIPALTIFALSADNLQRNRSELRHILSSIEAKINRSRQVWKERAIRAQFVGNLSQVSAELQRSIDLVHTETAANDGLRLTVALSYSGRQDILQSIQKLIQSDKDVDQITESDIESNLQSFQAFGDIAAPDLLIRTGGEQRLSNFMLWDLAYTELYFDNTLWPDYNADCFLKALQEYSRRERRYGR